MIKFSLREAARPTARERLARGVRDLFAEEPTAAAAEAAVVAAETLPVRQLVFVQERGIEEGRRGRALGGCARWDEAEACFLRAARADVDSAHLYYEMISQILLEKDEVFKALQFAQRAVAIDGDYIYGHWTLARCLRQFGEAQRALRAYDRVLALAGRAERDKVTAEREELEQVIAALSAPPTPGRNRTYNNRWFGALRFYELAEDVPPHLVPAWRTGKQRCCEPTD